MARPRKFDENLDGFYEALNEAFDAGKADDLFVRLPPPISRQVMEPLAHLARRHHMMNPDRGPRDGWIKVYDIQAEFIMAVPEKIAPEGIVSTERIKGRVQRSKTRLEYQLKKLEPMYGKFETKRVQGRVYFRHSGSVPVVNK